MSTTPLPPPDKQDCEDDPMYGISPVDYFTTATLQAYAQQARADLEAENARLREALTSITEASNDPGVVSCASAALKGTP